MTKYIAWVDGKECLDTECQAIGNSTWDCRAIFGSDQCFIADGHKHTLMGDDDTHALLGVYGFVLEPNACEYCSSCDKKVVQGVVCDHECDAECISEAETRYKGK